jgi:hypothetical protein
MKRNRKKTEKAGIQRKKAASLKDELFNLKDDPTETKNVISEHADLAAKMKKILVESRDHGFTRPGAGM